MSSISSVSSASPRFAGPDAGPAADSGLPPPSAAISIEDVTAVLLLLENREAEGSKDCAQLQIDRNAALQKKAREQMEQAQRQARERDEDGSAWDKLTSTFSSVSEIAMAAAALASVATGGAGLPAYLALAGATMSLGATAGREAGLDPKLCTGLAFGGMALSLGSGVAGAVGGANATIVKEGATKTGALTMRDVARTCRAVGGASIMAAGSAGMVAGHYHAQAARDSADALQARQSASRHDEAQKEQIDRLNEIAQSASSAISELIDMQASAHATAMQVISTIGRRA